MRSEMINQCSAFRKWFDVSPSSSEKPEYPSPQSDNCRRLNETWREIQMNKVWAASTVKYRLVQNPRKLPVVHLRFGYVFAVPPPIGRGI